MKVLRQRGTGHTYAFSSVLAKRSDMEEVEFGSASPATPVTIPVSAPAPITNPLDALPVAPDLFGNALAQTMAADLMVASRVTEG